MRNVFPLLLLLSGCYAVPESLPRFPGVPIEAGSSCAPSRVEPVACVLDGDTFDVGACGDDGERIRMLGVDAPEIAHDPDPADCYGDRAAQVLDLELDGQEVLLTFDEVCEGEFGRTLAWVFLGVDEDDEDAVPVNLNLWLVENGLARVYREFESEDSRYFADLEAAERSAQDREIGLWGACTE